MKCLACGSEIQTISGQLRSADEARTFIYTCPQCPLSVSKLTGHRKVPHIHVPKTQITKKKEIILNESSYSSIYVLSVHVKAFKENIELQDALCYRGVGLNDNIFKCYINGPFKGYALRESSKLKIGWIAESVSTQLKLSNRAHK